MQNVLPEKLAPITIYYHGINFWIEIISIMILFASGLILMKKRPSELDTNRHFKMGIALFVWFYAACRLSFIMSVWFPGEPGGFDNYKFFTVIGYLWAIFGLSSVIFVIEKYLITRTRRLFSILAIIFDCFYVMTLIIMGLDIKSFIGRDLALLLSDITSPILTLVIILLYSYLAFKGTAALRRNAFIILFSIGLIGSSAILDGEGMVIDAASWFPLESLSLDLYYCIVPAMTIIGAVIFVKVSIAQIDAAMIDFYTNKRICIVHKGEIKGKIFMCSKCNAFYCVKCKEAIESIDKCCWNCKTPFTAGGQEEIATLSPVEPSEEPRIDEGKDHKMKKQN